MTEDKTEVEDNTQEYNTFADKYQSKKKDSIINILMCGEILCNAKLQLSHGQWCNWIHDPRVSESERTASRLISIYNNYQHLLHESDTKLANIANLGVTHLLELQRLPDRFKKEIEVITVNTEGLEEKELRMVVDEDKVSNFLDTTVEVDGEKKSMRDLPVAKMRKFINEASGVYEPELKDEDYNPVPQAIDEGGVFGTEKNESDVVGQVIADLALLSDTMQNLIVNADKIDESVLVSTTEKHTTDLKDKIAKVKDQFSTLYMRLDSIIGVIR